MTPPIRQSAFALLLLAAALAPAGAQPKPTPSAAQEALQRIRARLVDAQTAWEAGTRETGWQIYRENAAGSLPALRSLKPEFVTWLLERSLEEDRLDAAEEIGRELIAWVDSAQMPAETKAAAQVAYANIALAREEYPKARARFAIIAANKDFAGTRARARAELQMAEVDRMTRQFESAAEVATRLADDPDPDTQMRAFHLLALIRFDQEDFAEAAKSLQEVFQRNPDYAPARILEGQLHLRQRKLVEATEVKVGLSSDQKKMVPGKPLKVKLEDRNLAIAGRAENIEIRAWTDSGDEEMFSLLPFGESKTLFEGSLNTALGPVQKGDRTLQVLGGDTVRYDFSEGFRKGRNLTGSTPVELVVASDGGLLVSSGEILTPEQIAEQEFEAMIREKMAETKVATGEVAALSERRASNQIKPGNPIHVRVSDADASRSAQVDRVKIEVLATSGDRIPALEISETGPFTGVFDASIATVAAPAVATASSSAEGSNPNHAISAGTYPAWVAGKENRQIRTYAVDLKDNLPLGELELKAGVANRRIKKFALQTSVNGREFETVAEFPGPFEAWDGAPSVRIARLPAKGASLTGADAFRDYFSTGALDQGGVRSVALSALKGVQSTRFELRRQKDTPFGQLCKELGMEKNEQYAAHFRAAFHVPEKRVRSILLKGDSKRRDNAPVLLVDGQLAEAVDGGWEVRRPLGVGVHRIDVFYVGNANDGRTIDLQWDIAEAPFHAPIPLADLDPATHPEIAAEVRREPATVQAAADGGGYTVKFPAKSQARVVRVVLQEYESDAPAIERLLLKDAAGEQVLPSKQDLLRLAENQTLEIVPGDRITVRYVEDRTITPDRARHEAFLTATYTNARINACFEEIEQQEGQERKLSYVSMRRFRTGDKVSVVIADADADVSAQPDKVSFRVRTAKGAEATFDAIENGPHSGVFIGNFFPVNAKPSRAGEVEVAVGEDIGIAYVDRENTDPGVPWPREVRVEQSFYQNPELRVFEVTPRPLDPAQAAEAAKALVPAAGNEELFLPSYELEVRRPEKPAGTTAGAAIIDGPIGVEILWPTVALSPRSKVKVYAQTSSGRKALGRAPAAPFDLEVPGTIRVEASPSNFAPGKPAEGCARVLMATDRKLGDALDDGRFTLMVPTVMGEAPVKSLVNEPLDPATKQPYPLTVLGGDTLHLGFEYEDAKGAKQWMTADVELRSQPAFHVMDRRYREELAGTHVGETIQLRVVDRARQTTAANDPITVRVEAPGNRTRNVTLSETLNYSGVFKGQVTLAHAAETGANPAADAVPVQYGDRIALVYEGVAGAGPIRREVEVFKGDDATLVPFTKRFRDPELAVLTQFTAAEAHFELAKKHRELGNEPLAWEGIQRGKKLLEEAMRDHPGGGTRAQADYLLANLELELGDIAKQPQAKAGHYNAAIRSFGDLIGNFPDSPYAPKSQFKKAVAFEKTGEIDQACEEYVKLSYRYPDNELVAETIARLGHYFFVKGKQVLDAAEKAPDALAREKEKAKARDVFATAGEVFGRLGERFPNHSLADRTTVLAGQCFMRAEDYIRATGAFAKITENPNGDKEARPEGMFWCGESYLKLAESKGAPKADQDPMLLAYRMYKRLTWDYPESKWAKYARGRLTEGPMAKIAAKDADQ
jgi:TolA-binding protein/uncharacterized protein YxjI